MPKRSSGTNDVRIFVSSALGVLSISWTTIKRMRRNDGFPLKYMLRGRKPLPYVIHDEVYEWIRNRGQG